MEKSHTHAHTPSLAQPHAETFMTPFMVCPAVQQQQIKGGRRRGHEDRTAAAEDMKTCI